MARYSIVAARPKNASHHLNSQFKLYKFDEKEGGWSPDGWRSIAQVSDLMRDGHEMRTGKIVKEELFDGAAVELELRIAKNDTNYKISEMPDT
jgi:hypothetical protein